MTARDLLDDPEFAGLIYQWWHITGDERQPHGNPVFVPRECGEAALDATIVNESDTMTVRPVRWHRMPCEVCGGTGVVQAYQNGRTGTHPCPRGCDDAIRAAAARTPTVTVQFDLGPALVEGAIRDKLIALGWTPPGQGASPAAWRKIAAEAYDEWDRDNDMRVGKLLKAMSESSFAASYRADIAALHTDKMSIHSPTTGAAPDG
jgi:hypothetical protein